MASPNWTLSPNSEPCLLFPSCEIVSYTPGRLVLEEDVLNEVIGICKGESSISDKTPVAIVSIVGSQSNEKYLLTKAIYNHYGIVNDGGGEQLGKIEELIPVPKSGLYLVNKPISGNSNGKDDATPLLVFVLDLCPGQDNASGEQRLLERFLLLVSSMMVEVKQEDEQFCLLRERDILENNKPEKWGRQDYHGPICDHLVYAFPSGSGSTSNAITSSSAKLKLKKIIKDTSSSAAVDNLAWEKVQNVSIIEIEKVKEPLYKGTQCQDPNLEKMMVQSLMNSLKIIHSGTELSLKMDIKKNGLNLGDLLTFMKKCVDAVNGLPDIKPSPEIVPEKAVPPPPVPKARTKPIPLATGYSAESQVSSKSQVPPEETTSHSTELKPEQIDQVDTKTEQTISSNANPDPRLTEPERSTSSEEAKSISPSSKNTDKPDLDNLKNQSPAIVAETPPDQKK